MEVRVFRRGVKLKEIARELGISKNTVKRYLRDPQAGRCKPRAPRPRKLDAYLEYLPEGVEAAEPRWIPATVLLREIRERGYEGGISQHRPVHPAPKAVSAVEGRSVRLDAGCGPSYASLC